MIGKDANVRLRTPRLGRVILDLDLPGSSGVGVSSPQLSSTGEVRAYLDVPGDMANLGTVEDTLRALATKVRRYRWSRCPPTAKQRAAELLACLRDGL